MAQGAFSSDTTWCLDEFRRFFPEVYDWSRPTVAVVLMKGNQVLLVQSSKRCDGEGVSWLLPQGGVDKGVTILQALSAELWQELNLDFPITKLGELWDDRQLAVLGSYVNQPRSDGDKPKLIVVVGIQVEDLDPIKLNAENTKYEFVWGAYQLWGIMATTRPRKVEATFSAISHAHARGLIGWSCDDVLQQLSQAAAA
jgi:8-oxo-dGTP pyrophosphatase MutT (NUDIX family)